MRMRWRSVNWLNCNCRIQRSPNHIAQLLKQYQCTFQLGPTTHRPPLHISGQFRGLNFKETAALANPIVILNSAFSCCGARGLEVWSEALWLNLLLWNEQVWRWQNQPKGKPYLWDGGCHQDWQIVDPPFRCRRWVQKRLRTSRFPIKRSCDHHGLLNIHFRL